MMNGGNGMGEAHSSRRTFSYFCPFKNIGVIIVDEEHEGYKQEEAPRYHARDLAIWRGGWIVIIRCFGSATPSVATWAQKGVYQLLRLNQRTKLSARLPQINVVDMREEFANKNYQTFRHHAGVTKIARIKNKSFCC